MLTLLGSASCSMLGLFVWTAVAAANGLSDQILWFTARDVASSESCVAVSMGVNRAASSLGSRAWPGQWPAPIGAGAGYAVGWLPARWSAGVLLWMPCRAITGSLRHHALSVIMFTMNSSQITARTITVTPASTASAGSEVVVQLSASPDPRWQACFHFVVQGRDGFFLQGRPVFDNASFHGVLQAGQAEAFRQEPAGCAGIGQRARACPGEQGRSAISVLLQQ